MTEELRTKIKEEVARRNHYVDNIIYYLARDIVRTKGIAPQAFFEEAGRVEVPDEWKRLRLSSLEPLIEVLVENADADQLKQLQDAITKSDLPKSVAETGIPQWAYALVIAWAVVSGGSVQVGPISANIPSVVELWQQLPDNTRNFIAEKLGHETPNHEEIVPEVAKEFNEENSKRRKSINALSSPRAFHTRGGILPDKGSSYERALTISKNISHKFWAGQLSLPDLPLGAKKSGRICRPWRPGTSELLGVYFIGAGVRYDSVENRSIIFKPSVSVFVPFPKVINKKFVKPDLGPLTRLAAEKENPLYRASFRYPGSPPISFCGP